MAWGEQVGVGVSDIGEVGEVEVEAYASADETVVDD